MVEQNGQRLRVMKGAVRTVAEACGLQPPAIEALEAQVNESALKAAHVGVARATRRVGHACDSGGAAIAGIGAVAGRHVMAVVAEGIGAGTGRGVDTAIAVGNGADRELL